MWLARVTYCVADAWEAQERFTAVRRQDGCLGSRLQSCARGYEIQAFFACDESWLQSDLGGLQRIFVSPDRAADLGIGQPYSDLGGNLSPRVLLRELRQLGSRCQQLWATLADWYARLYGRLPTSLSPNRALVPAAAARGR